MLLKALTKREITEIKSKLRKLDTLSEFERFKYAQLNCIVNLQEQLCKPQQVALSDDPDDVEGASRKQPKPGSISHLIHEHGFIPIVKYPKQLSDLVMSIYFSRLSMTPLGITRYYDVVSELTDPKAHRHVFGLSENMRTRKLLYATKGDLKRELRFRSPSAPYEEMLQEQNKELFDPYWSEASSVLPYMQDLDNEPSVDLTEYVKVLNNVNTLLKSMRSFIGNMHTKYLREARASNYEALTPFNFWGEYNRFNKPAALFCVLNKEQPVLSNRHYVQRALNELSKVLNKEVVDIVFKSSHEWANLDNYTEYSLTELARVVLFANSGSTVNVSSNIYTRTNKLLRGDCALRSARLSGLAPRAIRESLLLLYGSGVADSEALQDNIFQAGEDGGDFDNYCRRRYRFSQHVLHNSALPSFLSRTFLMPTLPNALATPRKNSVGVFGCSDIWSGFDYKYQVLGANSYNDLRPRFRKKVVLALQEVRLGSGASLAKALHETRRERGISRSWFRHNHFESGDLISAFLLRAMVCPEPTAIDDAVGMIENITTEDVYEMTHYDDAPCEELEFDVSDNSIYACRNRYPLFHATTLLCLTPNIFLPDSLTRSLHTTSHEAYTCGCGANNENMHTPELALDNSMYKGLWNTEDAPLRTIFSVDNELLTAVALGSTIGSKEVHPVIHPNDLRNILVVLSTIRQLCNFCAHVMDIYHYWLSTTFTEERYKNDIKLCNKIVTTLFKYGSDECYDVAIDAITKSVEPYCESLDF